MPTVYIYEISQVVLYDLTEALFGLHNETNNDVNDNIMKNCPTVLKNTEHSNYLCRPAKNLRAAYTYGS